MQKINIYNIKNWYAVTILRLNNTGNNNVNSTSYNTRNTHNNVKLILIFIFESVSDLKPHS